MQKLELTVTRGETVEIPIRVESDVLAYKAITAITQSAPVRITSTHGLKDGWRAAVANVGGMTQINFARSDEGKPPKDKDLKPVTAIDASTIEFNGVNAAGFSAYTSGGHIVFYEPLDLSEFIGARMEVKDEDGNRLALFATSATVADVTDGELEIDAANDVLYLRMTDEESAPLDFDEGFFDIEMLRADGSVKKICTADSVLTVRPEITTTE